MKECILNHLKDIYVWGIALFFLLIGIGIGKTIKIGFNEMVHKIINELNNFVLIGTFFLALSMYTVECFSNNLDNSKVFDILSFYVSFIFAWLLTQKSSKNELKKQEKRLGKMAYRHIEQVWENLGGVISDVKCIIEKYESGQNSEEMVILSELNGINNCLKYTRGSTEACMNDWNYIMNMDEDIIEKDNKEITQQDKENIDENAKNKFSKSNLGNTNNNAS